MWRIRPCCSLTFSRPCVTTANNNREIRQRISRNLKQVLLGLGALVGLYIAGVGLVQLVHMSTVDPTPAKHQTQKFLHNGWDLAPALSESFNQVTEEMETTPQKSSTWEDSTSAIVTEEREVREENV
eukprot:TRINITY_DN5442_c0_g2_i8.p1 TRINITY_DN5442_c0_g2~~TRINITY_DN5442_c0_g2_i8.p1  ORF type:complete len:127 (+),score=13.80 TRINITY_DN5442_c0_g2_i8:100-480(+)